MTPHKQSLSILLSNIRSAHNVGSIFRTADAVGVTKIYLCGYTPTPDKNDKVTKTALGAELTVPWEYHHDAWRIIKKLKAESYTIAGLEQLPDSQDYCAYKPTFPLLLILGNEVTGVEQSLTKYLDVAIEIPMHGTKESLNVSVAAGIALYKLNEKRL